MGTATSGFIGAQNQNPNVSTTNALTNFGALVKTTFKF
jgi:hypothetical protein